MTWDELLGHPFEREPHRTTLARAEAAAAKTEVFPPRDRWLAALDRTAPEAVRVVILGQDPYHEPGQANGLAFSVEPGTKLPPSLRNIFRELSADLGCPVPQSGDLGPWADRGVLLLNTVLTVEAGKANSHRDLGWQAFTDEVIAALAALPQPIVLILWGAQAQKKRGLLAPAAGPRLVLESVHPSPLSAHRGFFGSRPFSQANAFLASHGAAPIEWGELG